MGIIVGLDVGGSTTKVVGMDGDKIIGNKIVKADDPVTSAFGALGKLMDSYELKISDIEKLKITGVGASFPTGNLLGIPTVRIQEFFATGVGGGTLVGLSNCALNMRDFDMIAELAQGGNLNHVDLTIGDISHSAIPGLTMDTTASNFGKMQDDASKADIALGLYNVVFQSIGTMAVLSARNAGLKDVVFTGQATKAPMCGTIYKAFSELYNLNFIVPQMSEFATAIGAAIAEEV